MNNTFANAHARDFTTRGVDFQKCSVLEREKSYKYLLILSLDKINSSEIFRGVLKIMKLIVQYRFFEIIDFVDTHAV